MSAPTAERLGQHPNTVRYRLERVHGLTGLSYKVPADMELLSMATGIALCRRATE